MDTLGYVIYMLFMLLIIGGLAYVTTKFIGVNSIRRFQSSNFQIIEVMPIGFQKYLYLIKVTDEYMIFSVTKEDIKFVEKLSADKVKINNTDMSNGNNFKDILNSFMKKK